jgi:SPP1 gp7 family putative phage head morphogenesis protein
MFKTNCGCSFQIVNKTPDLLSESEKEMLLTGIYYGFITPENLDVTLYRRIALYIESGIYEGFGASLSELELGTPDFETARLLRENVYIFSAAKTFQQTKDMASAAYGVDGLQVPFEKFKKKASIIFEEYNNNWLRSEYDLAIHQARSAKQWNEIQKDKETLPYLKYDTAGDGRVRPEHRSLDGIIKRVDDPFWSKWMPPNDWGCRCDVKQLDEGEETDIDGLDLPKQGKLFKMNPGKDKLVFKNSHPYFKVEERYKVLAGDNFNLPLPN